MKYIPVPVIMYHSIGIPNRDWLWNSLTISYRVFEDQLKWMKAKKFNTISLQQLYDYMTEGSNLPKNSVVLTFDDGYLDNWVFAYPILKRYGFKGTIYVNPEFVDSRSIIRKSLEDVHSGIVDIDKLKITGYLSWKEIKVMEEEGIMDTQSHTMSHTWYPMSNKVIDFRHPGDSYLWKTWNDNNTKKFQLQIDNERLVNYGEPVYEFGRAIGVKRFYPDENLKMYLINYVKEKGNKDFFRYANWRDELFDVVKHYREKNYINEKLETEKDYEKRIYYELNESKKVIDSKLDKEVRFLCWPGGVITDRALKIALDIGYISFPAVKDPKNSRKSLKNRYEEDPSRIKRIGPTLYCNGIKGSKCIIKYKNGFLFILSLNHFKARKSVAPIFRFVIGSVVALNKVRYEIF